MKEQQPLFDALVPEGLAARRQAAVTAEHGERPTRSPLTLEETVHRLQQQDFQAEEVGRALLDLLSSGRYSLERAAAFVGLLSQAREQQTENK
ncbi:hypothetical protein [Streptomyces anthocyanicus]|uniref:hypothetical protein n=1 Tax=Streptomyces anthocyanicus TaxID=68174 RepID=UPI00365B1171